MVVRDAAAGGVWLIGATAGAAVLCSAAALCL